MKTYKRLLSVVLALVMVLSLAVPAVVSAAENSSNILLEDDFSGDLSKWTSAYNAQIVDGQAQIGANGYIHFAAEWTDYVVEFDSDMLSGNYRGVSFRRQEGTGDDYFWWFGDGNTNIKIVKRTDAGATWTDLSDVQPARIVEGTHHFKLVVNGSSIKTYVDGALFNVGTGADFTTGGILFFVAAGVVNIDNVKVTAIEEGKGETLFSEDFSADLTHWYQSEEATIVDGQVQLGVADTMGSFLVGPYAGADWTNYTLEFDADFGANVYRGISFRRQDNGDDYFWWFGDGNTNIQVFKRVSGNWISISDVKPAEVLTGTHSFKLEVDGANIKTYVDGALYNTAYDEDFATGSFLFFVNYGQAWFDNVTVTAIEEEVEITAPEGALFYDDFSGNISQWNYALSFINDKEQLQVGTVGGGMLDAVATPIAGSDWTNYTLEFDADFGSNVYRGISFRRQANGDDYFWWFGDGNSNIKVVKRVSGAWIDIGDVKPAEAFVGTHHFKLEVNGSTIKTYVDGNLYNTASDADFTTGGILFFVNYDAAWFDNVVVMPIVTCAHTDTTETVVDASCTEPGSVTVTCSCGETISVTELPALGHAYADGVCGTCGEADPDYVAPVVKFDLSGMTMSLGNSLAANFVVMKANLTGSDNYAIIEKAYADGTTKSVTIPQSQWQAYGVSGYYFTFAGVTAKEMTDSFTVNVYNADGVQIMNTYTRTIEGYCYDQIVKEEGKAAPDAEKLALYVDILKYGAAAQVFFENYNIENMATARLTEAQLAYGAQDVEMTDIRVKGEGYLGATLSLKSEISMNFVFQNATINKAAYATFTFTNHYGELKEKTVQSADFQKYGSSGKYIVVDGMSVADCSAQITVTLYDADGNALSTNIDSVEAYIARMSGAAEVYPAILKLAESAYNSFH